NLAEKTGVRAKPTLPEAAADNDLGPTLCAGEKPRIERFTLEGLAHQGYVKNLEELRRDKESSQPLASVASGQINREPSIACYGFEGFGLSLPVEQVRR